MTRQPWSAFVVAGSVAFGAGMVLLAAGTGSAASAGGDRPRLSVIGASISPPGSAAEVMAVATVRNAGGAPDTLIGVRTDVSTIVMIHEGAGGGMDMVDTVALPPRRTVALAASGRHIMIMQPTRALRPGDLVHLTFVFARSAPLSIDARVTATPGGPPPGHGDHRHGDHGHG
ncbi:MAG TPA: copper chaperone PCu(A)C [Streptosporangiaceae bacterium]|jgi:copper(I)-binding protein|nr:copper chaperone PCu(A)C [Streptosporangiaceae bacterium]